MNLEMISDKNLALFFIEELRAIEQTGRKPPTISYCAMDHLKRYDLVGTLHDNQGRRYTLTEKARELLKEVRK